MYYHVIKHSGHLGTLEKCRKHLPAARVFYISLVFSNARVLSQCNTLLRRLYLLNIGSKGKRHTVLLFKNKWGLSLQSSFLSSYDGKIWKVSGNIYV